MQRLATAALLVLLLLFSTVPVDVGPLPADHPELEPAPTVLDVGGRSASKGPVATCRGTSR